MQDDARALMSEAVAHLERLIAGDNEQASFLPELLNTRYLYWQQRGEDLFDEPAFSGIEVRFDSKDRSCLAQADLIRQAILLDNLDTARELTTGLLAKGYYEPGFIRTCRKYDLCE